MEEMSEKISDRILKIEYTLSHKLSKISFGFPVEYVYNPLDYAQDSHVNFVRRYFDLSNGKIMFLGMNPGPWGMCQNGIPFGEKNVVNNWFETSGRIERPKKEHTKVKIEGFDCEKSEVSGKRFWGLMKELFETPENFFKNCLVYNYCPLAFLKKSGTNITPTEIKGDKKDLYELCNDALASIISEIGIEIIICIGRFTEDRVKEILKQKKISNVKVYYMPHPSPRTGLKEENWKKKTVEILTLSGVYKVLQNRTEKPT